MLSVGTILTGAFAFGLSFNSAADRYWEWNNQGVRKTCNRIERLTRAQRLWKDIRAKVCPAWHAVQTNIGSM